MAGAPNEGLPLAIFIGAWRFPKEDDARLGAAPGARGAGGAPGARLCHGDGTTRGDVIVLEEVVELEFQAITA